MQIPQAMLYNRKKKQPKPTIKKKTPKTLLLGSLTARPCFKHFTCIDTVPTLWGRYWSYPWFIYFHLFFYFWLCWVFAVRTGFLWLRRVEPSLHCGPRVSHCSGFSCGRVWALGLKGSVVVVPGLSCPEVCASSQTRHWTCIPCSACRTLNYWTTREVLSLFYRWEHWSLERLYNLPDAAQPADDEMLSSKLDSWLQNSCS